MGTIQSSVGLVSGINSAQIIDQLLAIEARPRALAQQRLIEFQSQQAAYLDLNSAVLGLTTAARAVNANRLFRGASATSSDENVLTASAGAGATLGSFDFVVDRLVSTDSKITSGFADRDTTGIGLTQLSFEVGGGRLDSDTSLESLNGGLGAARGKISITDSSGNDATIDLSRAITVGDVLDAINSTSAVGVTASVSGYGITLTDTAGGSGTLTVGDEFGSTTATDLGIAGTATGTTLAGSQVLRIGDNTALSTLNDGNGVYFGPGGQAAPTDFTIDVDGTVYNIILGEIGHTEPDPDDPPNTIYVVDEGAVTTVGQLIDRINTQTAGKITVQVNGAGNGIELVGSPGASITVAQGPTANSSAVDLGLIPRGSTSNNATTTLSSRTLLAGINSSLASSLAGGQGIGDGVFSVTTADSSAFLVSVSADDSVSTIIDAINTASGGDVTASLNDSGNGLLITDNTTGGASLVIADFTGTAATDLGITTAGATGSFDSGNLQTRYISEATHLDDLRGGQGIGTGTFRITDSTGATTTVNIGSSARTVQDVLAAINSASGVGVSARINDNGDGILVTDTAGGAAALVIEDESGRAAADLNLVGTADISGSSNELDGSYEINVSLSAGDTLQDVVNTINDAGAGVFASIVSSGSGPAPHRLVLTSDATGAAGRLTIDTFGQNLGLSTLSRGDDAVAFFGSEDPAQGFLLTSRTNTLSNVIEGVTVDLRGASDDPVEVNITRDIASIESGLTDFADAFNNVLDRIDFHTRFVEDTNERGVLLGDSTVQGVKASLTRLALSDADGVTGQFTNLTQIGFSVGEGGQLSFDSEKFRDAYETDPDAVNDLIAALDADDRPSEVPVLDANGNVIPGVTAQNQADTTYSRVGVFEKIAQFADSLTDFVDGRFTRRKNTFDTQIGLQQDRIDGLTVQLDNKRARLEQQFLAMEQAIASLQNQQSALGALGA